VFATNQIPHTKTHRQLKKKARPNQNETPQRTKQTRPQHKNSGSKDAGDQAKNNAIKKNRRAHK